MRRNSVLEELRVRRFALCSHTGRDLVERFVSDSGVEIRWMAGDEKLCVICVKVVI